MITPEIRELADGSSTAGLVSSSMMNPPHPVWAGDILQVRAWKDGCGHCWWCHYLDHFRLLLNLKSREKLGHFSDNTITLMLFNLNQTQCSLFPEYDSNSLTMDWNSKISFSMKSQGFSLLPPKIMFSSASTVLQLLELLTSIVDWLTVMTEGI